MCRERTICVFRKNKSLGLFFLFIFLKNNVEENIHVLYLKAFLRIIPRLELFPIVARQKILTPLRVF